MMLSPRMTLINAILVLYLGKYLNRKIRFLREYNIPEPVSGGILASLVFSAYYFVSGVPIEFSLGIRDSFLLIFFTTIGLSSKLRTLFQGGKTLLVLLFWAMLYLFIQNGVGVLTALATGLSPITGLIAGSIALSGGHGTAIAWSPILAERYGLANAAEIGIATATFGLVLGGIIGGPIAKYLINRYHLHASTETGLVVGVASGKKEQKIDYATMLNAIFVVTITVGIGIQLNAVLSNSGSKLPEFVTCLLAGILLTNTIPAIFKRIPWPANTPSLALIADISLGLFLAISLMSLQLWRLAGLAGPIFILLFVQLIVTVLYNLFIIFRALGKDYDAAVIAAGYAGLTLGATPTAIANMTAITERFGPSSKAFVTIPLVGAFFIDIANAMIIQRFLSWIG